MAGSLCERAIPPDQQDRLRVGHNFDVTNGAFGFPTG